MDKILSDILEIIDKKHIISFSNDEIVIEYVASQFNQINSIVGKHIAQEVNLRLDKFKLEKFHTGYKKVYDDGNVEFKGFNSTDIIFAIREHLGQKIKQNDKVFVYENKLAKFIQKERIFIYKGDLSTKLANRFPWIENVYLECGPGWYQLLYDMFEEIEKLHLEENISIKTFEMLQLKEKYAQLRIYYKTHEEIRKTVDKIIEKYVDKSTEICEKCGKPGELVKDYYLSIMCNDCKIQNKEERRLSLLCESLFYVNKDWYNSFID